MAITLCPVAVVAGCAKCPVFRVCPLKTVIGDQPPPGTEPKSAPKKSPRGKG